MSIATLNQVGSKVDLCTKKYAEIAEIIIVTQMSVTMEIQLMGMDAHLHALLSQDFFAQEEILLHKMFALVIAVMVQL